MGKPSILSNYKNYLKNMPGWVRVVVGVASVLVGLWLFTKPFYSLTLMVVMLAVALCIDGAAKFAHGGASRVLGGLMILGGLSVLIMPSISVRLIALIVGIGLLVSGMSDLIAAVRGVKGARATMVIRGLAMIIFGVLALMWQDMSLLVVSFAFGAKLIIIGVLIVARRGEVKAKKAKTKTKTEKSVLVTLGKVANGVGAVLLLALAFGLTAVGVKLNRSVPVPDDFYSWTGDIPTVPGRLLRYESYTQAVPEGVRGWRILYSTTRDADGTPAIASAFVMAPAAVSDEPQPVVAWAHGTTGVVPGCAPTVLSEPFPLDATVPAVEQAFSNGWVMVGTDYAGLGTAGPHPYLIGQGEARSVLDSVRAVKQLSELDLADLTVVWGHSQGGHAALWTGGLAESYAPDVNVVGVAAAAPATELPTLLLESQYSAVGKIMGSFALRSYSEIYADVSFDEYVNPFLKPIVWEMTGRCLAETSTLLSIVATAAMPGTIYSKDPTTGQGGQRLNENIPMLPIAARLFIAQGEADPLVLPDVQQSYIDKIRAAGQELTYKTYPGLDHLTIVNESSPFNGDLEEWTKSVIEEAGAR